MGAAASKAALAVGVVVLAGAVGGCGGGGAQHARAKPSATVTEKGLGQAGRGGPVRTLSQGELERAVIGAKDLPGWETGTVVGRGGDGVDIPPTIVDVSRLPRITPGACQPLDDMTSLIGRHQYGAIVEQSINTVSAKDEESASMALTSYSVADAPKVIADLRASLRTCSSFRSPDPDISYVHPESLPDPRLGDEAVAYRIGQTVVSVDENGDKDGGAPVTAPYAFVVVRHGATIAAFSAMNFPGDPHPPQVPMNVVKAQIDKLDRVG